MKKSRLSENGTTDPSVGERERLARFEAYRSELDSIISDVRDELASHPHWRLSRDDHDQYQEVFQRFRDHGVRNLPRTVDRRGRHFLRRLRPIRLFLEGEIRGLEAMQQTTSAPSRKRVTGKGGRKPGIVLDGARIKGLRFGYSQPQFARFGKISPSSLQRAESSKRVSKETAKGICKAAGRCGHSIKVRDLLKKPTAEIPES